MKTKIVRIVATAVFLLASFPSLLGAEAVPKLINYQGKLTDASGNPLPNGTYGIAFRIWTNKTQTPGEQLIWGQEYTNVAVMNGIFNVILGAPGGTAIASAAVNDLGFAFTDAERYFGLTVTKGTNGVAIPNAAEIMPRQQVLSAPFSIRAASAQTAEVATTVPDGSITGPKIANGAVGSAQLAPGTIGFVPRSIQVFTSSGTWIRPAAVSNVYVKVVGRGGNGGTANDSRPRGGGGGGGYAEGYIAVTGNVNVTIGAINSFAGVSSIQATSGGNASGQQGGTGGVGSGGAINSEGSAGQHVSFNIVNGNGGMGGSSAMGAGGSGGAYQGGSSYFDAVHGAKFGGGGGGATWETHNGGNGDPGAVIVYY